MGDDRSYDPAEASHRALRGIQRELERHPSVAEVRGFPSGGFTRVVAELAPERLGVDADDATLTVRWFAGETPDDHPRFSFHYSGDMGDFGWHHEPNPHVDEWGHFQERDAAESEYSYEPHTFSSINPTRVVWEVMALLSSKGRPE
jgi:hypothetical protein